MPEPAVSSVMLIGLKYGVDGWAVKNSVIELGAGQVIKDSHIAGISGLVIAIILGVNLAKLFNKRLHHGHFPPNDATIEQGAFSKLCFIIGIVGYLAPQMCAVCGHPFIV